jgi:ubiquinone/menaquinone biosynthesis C-methylase UbiE
MGLKVTGVDPSPFMLKKAEKKLKYNSSLFLGTGENLPFDDKEFNLSIIFTTLEFCQNPSRVLKQAERVTSKKIFLGILNNLSLLSLQRRIKGWFKPSIYKNARFYNIWELKKIIRSSITYKSVEWGSVIFIPLSGSSIFKCLDRTISFRKNPFNSFLGILIEL